MSEKMVKLTGLWKRTSKNGTEYFSGRLGNANIVIYPNGYKTEDKHPDFVVYLSNPIERNQEQKSKKDINQEDDIPW